MAATLPMLSHLRRLIDSSAANIGSDAELLGRFVRDRDEAAFAALVARHGPMVLRLCRRVLGDADAAEDACQAAFLVLARKAHLLHHPEALAAWLHGVAYRLALKARAGEARRRHVETRSRQITPPPSAADPLAEVSGCELLTILDAELQRLPERYRLPLVLCCLEGRSQPEAARLLGWTPSSVKGRLDRGRAKLHQRLLRRGLTLSAALLTLEAAQGQASASLPAALAASVMRAAAGGASAGVAALAESGTFGMIGMKMKLTLLLALMLGAVTGGVSLLASGGRQPPESSRQQGADAPRSPKAERLARIDRYGDPLPPGALARLGTMRLRPGNLVFCLPDGKTFLSLAPGDEKWVMCLWRMATGKLLRRFEIPALHGQAALSADGKILATSHDDQVRAVTSILLWDVASGRRTGELAGNNWVRTFAFTPDGKALAVASSDRTLRLWDWRTANELRRFQGVADQWSYLAFSADGTLLASVSLPRRIVQLWDAASGRALHTLGGRAGRLACPAFAPDGKTLAAADMDKKMIRLWDVGNGKEVRQFPFEEEWTDDYHTTTALAFSPDGKALAVGGMAKDRKLAAPQPIHLWDVSTGREIRRFSGHVNKATSLAFSPDGKKLVSTGSGYLTMHVWDVATGKDLLPLAEHESYVECMAFSLDGRSLATGSLDGTVRLWEPAADKPARLFQDENPAAIGRLAFAPDGRSLAASEHDGSLRVWDVAAARPKWRVPMGEDHYYPSSAYSPDGRTLAVQHQDGTVRLLDAATGAEKRRLTGSAEEGVFLCFSPDGAKLAASFWSREGRGGALRLWDLTTGAETRKWTIAQPNVLYFPIAFSPDGQTVIGGTAEFGQGARKTHLHLWDIATGEERSFAIPLQARGSSMAISPDGRMLAWGDHDGTITLGERNGNQVRRRLKGHLSYVRSLTFSPDSKTLASGGADTTALLWDVTGRPAAEQSGPLAAERLRALWDDLASKDAAKAFDAIGLLTASPEQAVPLLKDKLRPAPAADKREVARLLADLDSEEFAVRQKAMAELRHLDERAEPALREALLGGKPPLETRKRIEELLEGVLLSATSGENLRNLRAVELLEHIGTPEARKVLQTLADGAPAARLTREAKATLRRLQRRVPAAP